MLPTNVSKYDLPEVAVLPGVAWVVSGKLLSELTDGFNVDDCPFETGGYPSLVFYYQAHVVFMRWIPYYPRYALSYVTQSTSIEALLWPMELKKKALVYIAVQSAETRPTTVELGLAQ